jgi:hypothetical protein
MLGDYVKKDIRSSAILTTSYVAGTIAHNKEHNNQALVIVNFTIGNLTSAEVKIEFTNSLRYTQDYDAQSANFTAGETLMSVDRTTTRAKIISDSDGGTTGTLTLGPIRGTAITDNQSLIDSAGGEALANGVSTEASTWYQETASSVTGGTSTETELEHKFTASGTYRLAIPLKDRYIKISAKGTGTVTGSLMDIDLIMGTV